MIQNVAKEVITVQALTLEASLHVRYGHNDGIDSAFFNVLSQGINRKWKTYRGHEISFNRLETLNFCCIESIWFYLEKSSFFKVVYQLRKLTSELSRR